MKARRLGHGYGGVTATRSQEHGGIRWDGTSMLGRLAPVGRRRVGALALQVKLDSRRPRVSCHWGQGCPVRVQTKPGSGSQPCSMLAPQAASRSQKNGCKSHAHLYPGPLVLSTHPVLSIKHQNAILCMCALPSASCTPSKGPPHRCPMSTWSRGWCFKT